MEKINNFFSRIIQYCYLYYFKNIKKARNITIQNVNEIREYHKWIKNIEKRYIKNELKDKDLTIKNFKIKPTISLLIPVYNTDKNVLEKAVNSIVKQWYPNWELCLYDDGSTRIDTIEFLKGIKQIKDSRIKVKFGKKNLNIALATNKAFNISTGEYVMLMDHDDELSEFALYEIVKKINEFKGSVDLIYFDDDKLDGNLRYNPYFKPDFSYEILYSIMIYIHAVYSRKIFKEVGKMRKGFDGSQDFDLCLRVVEKTKKIVHIPKILYHWRMVDGSTSINTDNKNYAVLNAIKAVNEAIIRRGLTGGVVNDYYPLITQLESDYNSRIDIVVDAKRSNKKEIFKTLKSIKENIFYKNIKLNLLVDNIDSFSDLKTELNINVVNNQALIKLFNRINSKYILYVKSSLEFIDKGILNNSLAWIEQEDIGIVSFKVLFPDGTINNAGIILSNKGIPLRIHYKQLDKAPIYFYNSLFIRNYLILGDEIILFKRSLLKNIKFDLNNLWYIELSINSYKQGLRNVFIPNLRCVYNGKLHKYTFDKNELKIIKQKYKDFVIYEPFANPNLDRTTQDTLLRIKTKV